MATIEQECTARNIDRLFHFTPVEHLDSILKHGLLTPRICAALSVVYKANDDARYDGQDAICLSIEWPNWSLFWSFRQRDTSRHWAILQLKHSLLWDKRVCFNMTNAADNSMNSLSFQARQGVVKFVELFDDYGLKKRADLNIPVHQTTNPQAEVLCIDNIESTYITDVHLLDVDLYRRYQKTYPGKHVTYGSQYFKYRDDWKHWK